ncbi:MAG: adenylyltransferase/cytidyltransferase family protein [Patescibacteria group bacterium]
MYSLESVVQQLKKHRNRKIVLVGGCYDIFHVGHLRILSKAKKLGDVLIVGINSDRLIKTTKSKYRPIIPEQQRAEVLMGLKAVDYVFITNRALYDDKNICKIKPDYLVFGTEKRKLKRRKKTAAGIEKRFPDTETIFLSSGSYRNSTTKIEARILKRNLPRLASRSRTIRTAVLP